MPAKLTTLTPESCAMIGGIQLFIGKVLRHGPSLETSKFYCIFQVVQSLSDPQFSDINSWYHTHPPLGWL